MEKIIAKKYLCFDALLEMIVADVRPPLYYFQEFFAELLGVTVPIGEKMLIKNINYSDKIEEFGTKICLNELNDFFYKNTISLQVSFVFSNYFNEMTFTEIIDSKSKNAYIVFAFCYGLLYNEPKNSDIGHVAILESIDRKLDIMQIYDPGPRNSGSKIVRSDDLFFL